MLCFLYKRISRAPQFLQSTNFRKQSNLFINPPLICETGASPNFSPTHQLSRTDIFHIVKYKLNLPSQFINPPLICATGASPNFSPTHQLSRTDIFHIVKYKLNPPSQFINPPLICAI